MLDHRVHVVKIDVNIPALSDLVAYLRERDLNDAQVAAFAAAINQTTDEYAALTSKLTSAVKAASTPK